MVHWLLLYGHHSRLKLIHILMLGICWLLHAISRKSTTERWASLLPIQNTWNSQPHLYYRSIKNVVQESLIINVTESYICLYSNLYTQHYSKNKRHFLIVNFMGSPSNLGENPKYHNLKNDSMKTDFVTECSLHCALQRLPTLYPGRNQIETTTWLGAAGSWTTTRKINTSLKKKKRITLLLTLFFCN